ncbi:MAG: L-histidine N(alpha)-methyltransferase [Rhodospirillales bacterium]|nr:L-histidine N(alpha)-methyltransferase [Rhodospirillales bacterium]
MHQGLALPQKAIPPRFFYDELGARLFTQICEEPEYYPTPERTGDPPTTTVGRIAALLPAHAVIVELGSGTSRKIDTLLAAMDRPRAYVPIDVSETCLRSTEARLRQRFPSVETVCIHADFTALLPQQLDIPAGPKVGFFPGSTIGNFHPDEAIALLRNFSEVLGPECQMLIGVDLKKDVRLLHAAYNDAAGTTAAFNLNILRRANRELGANFDLHWFAHRAPYNRSLGRIEMHLISLKPQTVTIDGRTYSFRQGETIHTENSYKYSIAEFVAVADKAGLSVEQTWLDRRKLFSVHLLLKG